MATKLRERTKALDKQQERNGTFLVFLRYERSEEFLSMSSFTIDPSFFEYMFLDNDKGDFLRVGSHSVTRATKVDAYNKILEFWVTFGENEDERREFFQDSKTISISVTDFGFEGQVINYKLPISGMFNGMLTEPKEILTSIRSTLNIVIDGAYTSTLTLQKSGQSVGDLKIPSRKGYTFGGWYKDAQYSEAWDTQNDVILDDTTLYAKWIANEYVVTLDSNGGEGGSVSVNVRSGSPMPPAIAPKRSGYVFGGYYDDKDGMGNAYFSNQMKSLETWDKGESTTLYAKWRDYYIIGDIGPAGGYIFYDKESYNDGWRYLEAAHERNEFRKKMWGGPKTRIGDIGTAVGTGETNTEKILAKFGKAEPYLNMPDYAAKVCADLTVVKDEIVYDDWFLPSKDELDWMYQNLKRNKLGGFAEEFYLSSSEIDEMYAFYQRFNDGNQSFCTKEYEIRVRPIRAF